jgi:acetolactate synthase-1/2/3 large subunit
MFPGLLATDCRDRSSFAGAVARAFSHSGPSVVSVELPEVEVPPFVAFQQGARS